MASLFAPPLSTDKALGLICLLHRSHTSPLFHNRQSGSMAAAGPLRSLDSLLSAVSGPTGDTSRGRGPQAQQFAVESLTTQ